MLATGCQPYLLLACLAADVVVMQLLEQILLPAHWQGQLPWLGHHLLCVGLHDASSGIICMMMT
jgi:hypothetical protein